MRLPNSGNYNLSPVKLLLFICALLLIAAIAGGQSSSNIPIPAIPVCADTAGQHLNFTSGAMTCGTSSSTASPLTGTTGSIGGGALLAGASATGTAAIAGATIVGRPCLASPSDGTSIAGLGVGVSIGCSITASGIATVVITAGVAGTPTAKTYLVTVP